MDGWISSKKCLTWCITRSISQDFRVDPYLRKRNRSSLFPASSDFIYELGATITEKSDLVAHGENLIIFLSYNLFSIFYTISGSVQENGLSVEPILLH